MLEPIAAILEIMPILYPLVIGLVGLLACTLSVGFITPPVGINLFAAAAVSGEPFMRIAVRAFPAFISLIVVCFGIAFIGQTVRWSR